MNHAYTLQEILEESEKKGYFSIDEYPRLKLSQQEMLELNTLLKKKNIHFGNPDIPKTITSKEAIEIINSLRRGIPSQVGTDYYSVGQEKLIKQVKADLLETQEGKSIVRFLNADIGEGKTHALYRLREFAFQHDYAVSIVTLSQNSCPLYDFMSVYHEIMWGLRTSDQRTKPALSNIIDRWVKDIRNKNRYEISEIVKNHLPPTICSIMAAYVDTTNLLRPNETKRQQILKFLGGDKMLKRDIRALGIETFIDSDNALHILSEMAIAIRYIGFKGICIFFDEAESIHSFASSYNKDRAYNNLLQIIKQSQEFPHCYFLYATTPSFIESFETDWFQRISSRPLLTLERLRRPQRQEIGKKIVDIYATAFDWKAPPDVVEAIEVVAKSREDVSIGNFVRAIIAIFDELRVQDE